jgi:DNA-binding MarR family transcriptional regulator
MNSDQIFSRFGNGMADELDLLLFEVNAISNRLRQLGRSIHRADFPAGTVAILQSLLKSDRTVPEIARQRSSSRQNIQVIVNCLVQSGWVEAVANPAHKRSDLLQITPTGVRFVNEAVEREAAFLNRLLPYTSEHDVLSAAKLLRKLRSVLSGNPVANTLKSGEKTIGRKFSHRKIGKLKSSSIIGQPDAAPEASENNGFDDLPVNLL